MISHGGNFLQVIFKKNEHYFHNWFFELFIAFYQ